jgi:hypothetical protein
LQKEEALDEVRHELKRNTHALVVREKGDRYAEEELIVAGPQRDASTLSGHYLPYRYVQSAVLK